MPSEAEQRPPRSHSHASRTGRSTPSARLSSASPTSVLIPSLRGGAGLRRLVERLRAESADTELIVADNGMPEADAKALQDAGADVLRLERNLGFGAAVNRAAREAGGMTLVVLNDDITPEKGFLSSLVEPLAGSADMSAGVLLREERPKLIETAGVEIDAALGSYDYLQNEHVSRLAEPLPPPLGPCGGAAAYKRDAFFEVGGFDEGFFAYGEDVDLALRLRAAGAACALARDARALHAGSATLGYQSLSKAAIVGQSRGYLLRKYGVLSRLPTALPAIATEVAVSLVLGRRHRSLEPLRARIRGWRDCRTRETLRPERYATVSFIDGLRRRYARSNRLRTGGS